MKFYVVWLVIGDGRFTESEHPVSAWPTRAEAEEDRKALDSCSYVSEETWGQFKGWEARCAA